MLPDEVELLGTVRTLDAELQQQLHQRIERTASHLAEASGVGVEVHDAAVPLAPGVAEAAALAGLDPLDLALGGGEDFVLAAALPRTADLGGVLDCGRFTPDPATRVRIGRDGPRPLAGLAWDHFRSGG